MGTPLAAFWDVDGRTRDPSKPLLLKGGVGEDCQYKHTRACTSFESRLPNFTSDLFGSLVKFDKGTRSACCASADLSMVGCCLLRKSSGLLCDCV